MDKHNRKDRNTLKEYFRKGKTPTEEQFAEWIDSTPNIEEDGQLTRTASGWAFYPKDGGEMDIGLYTAEPATDTEPPVWSFRVTPENKLLINNRQGETVVEVAQDKSVVLHGKLSVKDELSAAAYHKMDEPGGLDYLTIPADKEWHDIPLGDSHEGPGCHVYHLYASCREPGKGACRLTRVIAIWLNRLGQRIESPEKRWWGWWGDVRLRWVDHSSKPCLQIRSKKRLPSSEIHIRIMEMYKG